MGDRVLFQVVLRADKTNEAKEFSPVMYGHWSGSAAPGIAKRIKKRMGKRTGDTDYTAARLIQEMINGDNGELSFGMWNADRVLTEEDSHGDAGVVLVNLYSDKEMSFECFGGYLAVENDEIVIREYQEEDE
jgi:hypothetical protein